MAETSRPSDKQKLFNQLYADRVFAHQFFFSHRHPDPAPPYQADLIRDFHSMDKEGLDKVFRGGAKTTIAEEAIAIQAGFREFKYAIVVGSTIDLAIKKIEAIRFEIETNERLGFVFGESYAPGAEWAAGRLLMASGVMMQALGREQSLRGIKFRDQRPDFLFGDDLVEEAEEVDTKEKRDKQWVWLTMKLMKALDVDYRARIAGTPMDPDDHLARLEKDGWKTRTIPVKHLDEEGNWRSSWPARFPLTREDALRQQTPGKPPRKSIEEMEATAQLTGVMHQHNAEMMCEAKDKASAIFVPAMFTTQERDHRWEPVACMFDPNRTVKATSSRCGFAAWSWLSHRLIVWDAWQKLLTPAEIIEAMFQLYGFAPARGFERMCDPLYPVFLGVEEDGLNEWILQPIRAKMVERCVSLPVIPMRAPKDKRSFIRALQVFFNARDVRWAKPLPDLEQAFLSFPTGIIDAPNALAYAPMMRGGAPIYPDFGDRHVMADLAPNPMLRTHLAMHSTGSMTTGVLCQYIDGAIRAFKDWIAEGEVSGAVETIVSEARLEAGTNFKVVCPPIHFDQYRNVGLVQAMKGLEPIRGRKPEDGRPTVRKLLQAEVKGFPGLMVSEDSRWTLNALAGGMRFNISKAGLLDDVPEEGRYKLLMEGFESFVGLSSMTSLPNEEDEARNWAYDRTGRRYESLLPQRG